MNQFAALNKQYIGGVWREGSSQKVLADTNPYNGNKIADFKLANLADLDEAYRAAAAAQKIWAEVNPFEKRAIMEKAIAWVEKHEADITDIIIEELGGTALKAFFEIGLVKNIIKEASSYPLRMTGEPEDITWAMLYLASDAARFMTGQVLRPNGGVVMP